MWICHFRLAECLTQPTPLPMTDNRKVESGWAVYDSVQDFSSYKGTLPECQSTQHSHGQFFPLLPLHCFQEDERMKHPEAEMRAYFLLNAEETLILIDLICHSANVKYSS